MKSGIPNVIASAFRLRRLEIESGPLEYQQSSQNRQVDENPDSALVIQMLETAVPKEEIDYAGKHSRTQDRRTPPGLLCKDTNSANHKSNRSQSQ